MKDCKSSGNINQCSIEDFVRKLKKVQELEAGNLSSCKHLYIRTSNQMFLDICSKCDLWLLYAKRCLQTLSNSVVGAVW